MKMLFLLLVPLLACLSLNAAETLPLEASWRGAPVPPGARVSLRLPETVVLGHEIPAALVVQNEGKDTFEITPGGDYRTTGYPQRMKVRVRDEQGVALPELPREAYGDGGGGLSSSSKINAGESKEVEFPLDCYVQFTKPGAYTVFAGHDLGWKIDAAHPHPVAQAVLNVTMPTETEAAAYVDAVMWIQPDSKPRDESEALGRQSKLAKTLSVLRHPIYLPALIKHAQSGVTAAVKGIGHIATPAATEALLTLLGHDKAEVVETAAQQILRRLPPLSEDEKAVHSFFWGSPYQIEPLLPASWEPRFDEPLIESALKMLSHESSAVVQHAGTFLQTRGTPQHAPLVLQALQKALDTYHEPQYGPKANTLDLPVPQRALIGALDGLRKRGWRLESSGGGTAHLVAWMRQLADKDVPKPDNAEWKTSMLTWVENGPKALKIAVLEALPMPLTDVAAKAVMKELEDPDWGVMRVACEVAGKSKRPEFARPLVQIVETAHENFVQYAARDAAKACGAAVELLDALAGTIVVEERMADAIGELIHSTIKLPPSNGGGGNSNFTREERFAIRDAWRAFLTKHRAALEAGQKVALPDEATTAALTGMNFSPGNPAAEIHFEDGTQWPPRREKKQ